MSADPVLREASSLMRLLRHLRKLYDGFTTTELITLLAVAENEGVTVNGLSRLCGYTAATASRTARGLAPADMPGALAPRRGLMMMMSGPHESRFRYIFLTPEGVALCRDLDRILMQQPNVAILAPSEASA